MRGSEGRTGGREASAAAAGALRVGAVLGSQGRPVLDWSPGPCLCPQAGLPAGGGCQATVGGTEAVRPSSEGQLCVSLLWPLCLCPRCAGTPRGSERSGAGSDGGLTAAARPALGETGSHWHQSCWTARPGSPERGGARGRAGEGELVGTSGPRGAQSATQELD